MIAISGTWKALQLSAPYPRRCNRRGLQRCHQLNRFPFHPHSLHSHCGATLHSRLNQLRETTDAPGLPVPGIRGVGGRSGGTTLAAESNLQQLPKFDKSFFGRNDDFNYGERNSLHSARRLPRTCMTWVLPRRDSPSNHVASFRDDVRCPERWCSLPARIFMRRSLRSA